MGRLIDADEYKKWLIDNYVLCDNGKILNDLDRQPTVDAVPVVRCKDCVCWGTKWKMKTSLVEYGDCLHLKDTSVKSDFFCAWGERREDE